MGTGRKGKDVVVLINGTAVAGARGCTLNRPTTTFDTTVQSDYPNRTKAYGWNDSSLSLSGMYVPDDSAYEALEAARAGQTEVTLSEQVSSVVKRTATALVTNITEDNPYEDISTFTIDFEISGGWTDA